MSSGQEKAQLLLDFEPGTFHTTAQLLLENVVAKRFIFLATHNNLFNEFANSEYCSAVEELPYALTKQQDKAVITRVDNSVSYITDGAETGKTMVLRTTLIITEK